MSFKILSWNINGIRAFISKQTGIKFINTKDPDIICFQEIRLDDEILLKKIINVYFEKYPYYSVNISIGGRSGVLILSKIKPKKILNYTDETFKSRINVMIFKNLTIVNVYVVNSGDTLINITRRNDWDKSFYKLMNQLLKKHENMIICGDLNVTATENDIWNPKITTAAGTSTEERKNFEKLLEIFHDIFRITHPNKKIWTWFSPKDNTRTRGWRLDYFLISEHLKIIKDFKCLIFPKQLESDHVPLMISFEL